MWLFVVWGTLIVTLGTANAKNPVTLELTHDGQPAATIVVAEKPTRSAQMAALELQHHVQKITAATLPIRNDMIDVEGTRILVGESKATVSLGLKNNDFKAQEYLIRFLPGTLILMGRDEEDRGKVDYADAKTFPGAYGSSDPLYHGGDHPRYYDWAKQGTCYAVYDFLERYCDVRWYLPTELGLVCPSTKTLRVTGTELRRSPAMKHRFSNLGYQFPRDLIGVVMEGPSSPVLAWREQAIFMSRLRFGGRAMEAGHTTGGYIRRFWDKPKDATFFESYHPEFFAQGHRHTPPARWQLCYMNPGLIQQVVRDARDYFDGKGMKAEEWYYNKGESFIIVPGDNCDYCKCPRCAALIKKIPTRGHAGNANDMISDYWFAFVNKVAREVKKSHPDKWIGTIAYSRYAYPPTHERLEPNVWIKIVLDSRRVWSQATKDNYGEVFDSWVAESKERPKTLWLWYCFPAISGRNRYHVFPGFFAHSLVRQMKKYHQSGIQGFSYEVSGLCYGRRSPLLDQLACYLTFKLADDPTLDGDKVIDEFFDRYYGAAAEPMQAFYEMVEDIYSDQANYPAEALNRVSAAQTEEIAWKYLGTGPRMVKLEKLMVEARAAAKTEVEKKRVALFDKGIWQRMQAGRETYLKHEAIKANVGPIAGARPAG